MNGAGRKSVTMFRVLNIVSVYILVVANDNAPVHALRPGFLSTFALATDQGSKLGLSKNKSIICYYNTYQVRLIMPCQLS